MAVPDEAGDDADVVSGEAVRRGLWSFQSFISGVGLANDRTAGTAAGKYRVGVRGVFKRQGDMRIVGIRETKEGADGVCQRVLSIQELKQG